jgi:hypothetical protein
LNEKECADVLHSAVFHEYKERIEAHFRATDARILSDRQAWEREFKSLSDALRLQAAEYERRLTVLNHAHEDAIRAQAMTVPREMFNGFLKDHEAWKQEYNKWRDIVNSGLMNISNLSTRISDYESFKLTTSTALQSIATRSLTWTAAIGIFFLMVGIAMRFLKL